MAFDGQRHFEITNQANVSLRFLVLDGNKVGGGIHVSIGSSLSLDNIIAKNNIAENGGAIYLQENCSLKIANSSFLENESSKSGGGVYMEPDP